MKIVVGETKNSQLKEKKDAVNSRETEWYIKKQYITTLNYFI